MNNIIEVLKHQEIVDILQIGVVHVCKNEVELITNNNVIFIKFETTYLKLEAIEQNSKLEISQTHTIEFGDIPTIEDLPPFKHSIANIIFINEDFVNRVKSIHIYGKKHTLNDKVICSAIMLQLHNQDIFFDPSYYWGINIGNELKFQEWLKNKDKLEQIQMTQYLCHNTADGLD